MDTENISDPEVLIREAESAGLSAEGAREVIETRSFKAAIDADWTRSRDLGVTGVPTFVAGGHGLVGAQPYEMLEQLVTEAAKESKG